MKKYLIVFAMMLASAACFAFDTAHPHKHRAPRKAYSATRFTGTDSVMADDVLLFAQTLIGTRYRTASSSPLHGFDCSGFVSYVFKSFNFDVPRSSCEFIGIGQKIAFADARPGDVILFTGTSKRSRRIGHIGIVMSNDPDSELTFIHSTSGKEHGVTITTMDKRYHQRFVQIIRLLKQNDEAPVSEG